MAETYWLVFIHRAEIKDSSSSAFEGVGLERFLLKEARAETY